MSVTFRPCVLIPCYNHGAMMAKVLSRLAPFGLPCLVVDDGSDEQTRRILERLAAGQPQLRWYVWRKTQVKVPRSLRGWKSLPVRAIPTPYRWMPTASMLLRISPKCWLWLSVTRRR